MQVDSHILIMNGNEPLLRARARLLREAGYSVTEAMTGQDGLRQAQAVSPDLILLDIVLPDLPGSEVYRRLKASPTLSSPFVILTSSIITDADIQEMALEIGADGGIAHPVAERGLLARIGLFMRLLQAERRLRDERAIHERQLQERITALEVSEERLRGIITQSHDGIVFLDHDGAITVWNRAMATITGLPSEEVIGRPLWDVQYQVMCEEHQRPEMHAMLQAQIVAVLQGDDAPWLHRPSLQEIQCADGERRHIRSTIFPITTSQGRILASISQDVTNEHQAEQRLREQEERFRFLAENSHDVIWTLDADGHFTYISPSVYTLLGYTPQEGLQLSLNDIFTPASLHIVHTAMAGALADIAAGKRDIQNTPYQLEQPRKDGTTVWTESMVRRVFADDGSLQCFLGVTRDISDRKRAEDALRESEELHRSLISASPDNVTATDVRGVITFASPRSVAQYGYDSQDDVLGRSAFELIAPEDRERAAANLQHTLQDGIIRNCIYTLVRKDGTRFIGELNAAVVYDAQGDAKGFVATTRDITERVRMERALQESEMMYRMLFENMAQGVICHDAEGRVIAANPAAEQILGVTFEQMRGTTSMDPQWRTIHEGGSEYPGELHPIVRARKTGMAFHDDVMGVYHQQKGDYIWINTHAIPVFHPDEERPYQVYAIFEDITDRRNTEFMLRRSRNELRHLARRLATTQETERQHLARELHDQIGQNIAALGVLLSAINEVVIHALPDHAADRLAAAMRLTGEIAESVRRVMLDLRPPVLDDYGLLAALQWMGRQLQQQAGITIDVQGIGNIERLPADIETALFRITQEALTNVLKHAQASTVFLTLQMHDDVVNVTVADDGVGFASSRAPADASRLTGWGLINMQERTRSIGGTLKIDSRQGQGTRVTVMLPRRCDVHHDSHRR